jgi:hypothetical protein
MAEIAIKLPYKVHSVVNDEMMAVATFQGVDTQVKVPILEVELTHEEEDPSLRLPHGTVTLRFAGQGIIDARKLFAADKPVWLYVAGEEEIDEAAPETVTEPEPEPEPV